VEPAVRQAALAGTWYPAHPPVLRGELEGHLRQASPADIEGRLVALVSPHAGLMYSGAVAAHGYALLRHRRNLTVVLVGPSHRQGFDGLALYDHGAWETPLGRTPIDEDVATQLLWRGAPFFSGLEQHRYEHSLEMQLPFLQHVVANLRIVPMIMGWQSADTVNAAAAALAEVCRSPSIVVVASSDLSHYHEVHAAQDLDRRVVNDVERFDGERLLERLGKTPEHACGGGPIVAVMKAARAGGADRSAVLRYGHSGEAGARELRLQPSFAGGGAWDGAFVSLHQRADGALRGCIGFVPSRWGVVESVARAAEGAVTKDPRFEPVTAAELPALVIEVSLLARPHPIRPDEVVVGRHGLILDDGRTHGLLLPQVPVERGWSREKYLDQLALKAGLARGAWRHPAVRLEAFEAAAFSEA
jgi:AmmeMemoRadiSam system protein B/uncharacterized protein (TIGR00296 family)